MNDKFIKFIEDNKEVLNEILGLTPNILKDHLKEALQIQKGYFKNKKGEYQYVKGIEVTNDIGNLCRMGFNGEDRGVWIHYVLLNEHSVLYNDVPIFMFTNKMNPAWTKPEDLLVPTTKEDFMQQLAKTIGNIVAPYQEKRDINEYLDVLNGWSDLEEELL